MARLFIDARLPIRFGPADSRRPEEALLTDADFGPPDVHPPDVHPPDVHPIGCLCCVPRSAAASALSSLFRARAVGQGAPFRGVLAAVAPSAEQEVRDALAADPVVSARYRLG